MTSPHNIHILPIKPKLTLGFNLPTHAEAGSLLVSHSARSRMTECGMFASLGFIGPEPALIALVLTIHLSLGPDPAETGK
jgi:hypothetical protein